MTASGTIRVQTPIAGLVDLALRDPSLQDVTRRAADRPADLALVGPASARVFAAGALAQAGPLLVVTATGREADDLTAELRGVFGDSAAMFPSWETLPHERLSPGVDTVGERLMVLRRLANPDDERLGPPLRVVVTTVRSLLQPMAPDLADIEPVTLTVGQEAEFNDVIARLVELAYTRVDMVGKRGRVRGARRNPRRVPAHRRTPVPGRVLGRRGLRDADVRGRGSAVDHRHRRRRGDRGAVPRTAAHRRRPGPRLRARRGAPDDGQRRPRQRARHAGQARRGHPRRRHGGTAAAAAAHRAFPAQRPSACADATAGLRSGEGAHPGGRPDQDRPRVPRSVLVDGGGGR